MTDSSASKYSEIPVITGLRSLPRVQSIAEQSNYASLPKPNTPILTILQHSRIYLGLRSKQEKDGSNISMLDY